MKFGLFYLPTHMPEKIDAATHLSNMVEQVVYADQIGIDYAWFVEHHFVRHGGLSSAPFSMLSYLAGRTRNIRLGTGATVLPLNDPIRVAESTAVLDQLSRGRADLGIGRGFLRDEFDAFGVPMRETRERLEDGIALVKQAWTGEPVNYSGPYRPAIDNLRVLPGPLQQPHPPIWVACLLSPESFEWTAREGYNLLYVAYHVDPATAAQRIGWYTAALEKNGRRITDHEVACVYHAHFLAQSDDKKLRAAVDQAMGEYTAAGVEAATKAPDPIAYKGYAAREDYQRQSSFELYYPERVLMGGPDQVLTRLEQMRRMGITQVGMLVDFGSMAQDEIMASLEVFGRDILPEARKI
jgi:natural product biosynthesis luciferase-like monooxygenase protein